MCATGRALFSAISRPAGGARVWDYGAPSVPPGVAIFSGIFFNRYSRDLIVGVRPAREPGARDLLPGSLGHDGDAFGLWIEHDPGLATLELADDPRDLVVKRNFPLAVVGALAQDEGLDDGMQQFSGQLRIRHHHGFRRFIFHT